MKKINNIRDIEFETFSDKQGRERFRVLSSNGKILAKSSKGFEDSEDLTDVLAWIAEEVRAPSIYRDKLGAFRWRCRMGNEIALVGTGTYDRHSDCTSNAWLVLESPIK